MASLFDLVDEMIKEFYKINDDELDYICEFATDEEIDSFMSALGTPNGPATFTQRKKGVLVKNKYKQLYNESQVQTDS